MCVLTEDRVRAAIKAAALTRRRRHDRERERASVSYLFRVLL